MAVHRLSETEIAPRLRLIPPVEDVPESPPKAPTQPMRETVTDTDREAREQRTIAILVQATATLSALAKIVSARLILLLAVVGAFALALFVLDKPTWPALATLGLYVIVVGGLVGLESGALGRRKD